jgi:hypothetical protein
MKNKTTSPSTTVDEQSERFELAFRLIERYDHHLDSLESRAATIISADALLLAGTTFLIDKVFSQASQFLLNKLVFIGISIGIALVALAFSIVYAATTIANVWRTTRKIVGGNLPKPSLFFRSSDTVKEFEEFSDFKKHFQSSSKEEMLAYAVGELWLITNLSIRRQKNFERAARLLLFSVIPFLTAYALLIVQ